MKCQTCGKKHFLMVGLHPESRIIPICFIEAIRMAHVKLVGSIFCILEKPPSATLQHPSLWMFGLLKCWMLLFADLLNVAFYRFVECCCLQIWIIWLSRMGCYARFSFINLQKWLLISFHIFTQILKKVVWKYLNG